MRVILYARVSTQEQAESGVSLEAQTAKLEAYCALYNLQPIETILDRGESAKSLCRPGILRALAMLRSGEADGICVTKLDRLTRNIGDWQNLVADYFSEKSGKALHSVEDRLDSNSAMGRLIINVTLSVSQWERETTAERTKSALQHLIKRGQRVGATRFGFDLGADGHTLAPNPAEQDAIALMIQLRQSGLKLRQIAAELSARGIKTKQGLATWTHQAVAYILKQDRSAVAA